MPIYRNGKKITKIMRNGQEINKVYRGNQLVYENKITAGTVLWSGTVNPESYSYKNEYIATLSVPISKTRGIKIVLGSKWHTVYWCGNTGYGQNGQYKDSANLSLSGSGQVASNDLTSGEALPYSIVTGNTMSSYSVGGLSPFTFPVNDTEEKRTLTVQQISDNQVKIKLNGGTAKGSDSQHSRDGNGGWGPVIGHETAYATVYVELQQIIAV